MHPHHGGRGPVRPAAPAAGVTYTVHYGADGSTTTAPVQSGTTYTFTPPNNTSGTFWVSSGATVSGQQWTADSARWGYQAVPHADPSCSRL